MTQDRMYHVDGKLVDADSASVSVRDRGFLYGDAAFETIRAYGGHCFEWNAHRERLEETCERLGMAGAVPQDLHDRVIETLAANDLADAYVRVSVTRGRQAGRLTPEESIAPTVVVIVEELPAGGTDGERVWDEPATLATVPTRRIPDAAIPAAAKTHNYLNGILARVALRGTDADEALLQTVDGTVVEGATSNVFFVADGVIHTPSLDGPVLPGVTRAVVLDLAEDLGVATATGTYPPARLQDAEELFLTNTTWEVRPVTDFDNTSYGIGPVTERLQTAFDRRVDELY